MHQLYSVCQWCNLSCRVQAWAASIRGEARPLNQLLAEVEAKALQHGLPEPEVPPQLINQKLPKPEVSASMHVDAKTNLLQGIPDAPNPQSLPTLADAPRPLHLHQQQHQQLRQQVAAAQVRHTHSAAEPHPTPQQAAGQTAIDANQVQTGSVARSGSTPGASTAQLLPRATALRVAGFSDDGRAATVAAAPAPPHVPAAAPPAQEAIPGVHLAPLFLPLESVPEQSHSSPLMPVSSDTQRLTITVPATPSLDTHQAYILAECMTDSAGAGSRGLQRQGLAAFVADASHTSGVATTSTAQNSLAVGGDTHASAAEVISQDTEGHALPTLTVPDSRAMGDEVTAQLLGLDLSSVALSPLGQVYSPGGTLRSPFHNTDLSASSTGSTIFGQVHLPGSPNMHSLELHHADRRDGSRDTSPTRRAPSPANVPLAPLNVSGEEAAVLAAAYAAAASAEARFSGSALTGTGMGSHRSGGSQTSGTTYHQLMQQQPSQQLGPSGMSMGGMEPSALSPPQRFERKGSSASLRGTRWLDISSPGAPTLPTLPPGAMSMPASAYPAPPQNAMQSPLMLTSQQAAAAAAAGLLPAGAAINTPAPSVGGALSPLATPVSTKLSNRGSGGVMLREGVSAPTRCSTPPPQASGGFPVGVIRRASHGHQPVRFLALLVSSAHACALHAVDGMLMCTITLLECAEAGQPGMQASLAVVLGQPTRLNNACVVVVMPHAGFHTAVGDCQRRVRVGRVLMPRTNRIDDGAAPAARHGTQPIPVP